MPNSTSCPFLQACLGQSTNYTPTWIMRQAGRYLPEYCALRAKAGGFMAMMTNPELATEATLQPIKHYPLLDAAIIFSDILTIPDAMGLGLSFQQSEGIKFARNLRHEEDIKNISVPDMNLLRYVFDAIALTRCELNKRVPLIGFAGSPWTLACYMVEGASSSNFTSIKTMLYARPDLLHHILTINAQSIAQYLNAQIEAGAQAVMLFDSWAGILADDKFTSFSLDYNEAVLKQVQRQNAAGEIIPRIVFARSAGQWLPAMRHLSCDVLGLDWTVNLKSARTLLSGADGLAAQSIQGNLDPSVLLADTTVIKEQTVAMLDSFGNPDIQTPKSCQHICNLGHGISQHTPPEHVELFLETVRQHSTKLRTADSKTAY